MGEILMSLYSVLMTTLLLDAVSVDLLLPTDYRKIHL